VVQRIVVPYDPEWPRRFEAERARLEKVLSPWLQAGIHHIGSTAVPGLAAKPIIDMMAGIRDLEEARDAFGPLHALGYEYREHRPEAHLFWTPTHGVHLTEPGSDLWRERLAFRDALRADPALAAEYQEWKLRHAATEPGAGAYTAEKRPFVARVLMEAGITLKPDSARLTKKARDFRRPTGLHPANPYY
jgi:GrpB-like predicted nucleotidyltransferase (UPF0157 family)